MALIIDQGGEPKLVHESVLKAIEEGLDVVLGGEVVRPIDRTVGTPDDAVLVGKEQKT
jgi:hypothetical protein